MQSIERHPQRFGPPPCILGYASLSVAVAVDRRKAPPEFAAAIGLEHA